MTFTRTPITENPNPATKDIDLWPVEKILYVMNMEDHLVPRAITPEIPGIAKAVRLVVDSLSKGGRLFYAGAGTSGRIGVLDASELPPTFGLEQERVKALISGGNQGVFRAVEGAEDDEENGKHTFLSHKPTANDVLIGIASSGTTPFVVGALKAAIKTGTKTVAVVGDPSGTIAKLAQIVIAPNVGPEVIAGSTRLKNGTAQKLVLNMISTCAMIKLGRTYSHYMAGTIPANRKLNKRAIRLLKDITGANQEEARKSLEQAGGEIPVALVSLMCGISVYQARERLKSCHGMIRKAIEKTPQMEPYADCQSNFHYTCHLAGFDAGRLEQAFQLLDRHIGDGYQDIPSAVGCVVRKGFIIGPKAYGLTSREGEVRKAAWDTIYDLASLTKVVATTPSVLLLAQQGYIRLDDKVSFFIPEFSTKGKGDITIRQLLTHTSSLPAHIRFWEMGLKGDEVFKAICDIDLVENVEPGTKVIYSDLGFITLGEIVKRVTGLSIDKYSAREVFEHLGMKDTGFVPDPSLKPRIAATEYRKDLGRIMWGQVHDENCYAIGGIAGHAGLFGTAADLAKYALMWLNLGKLGARQMLSPAVIKAACRPYTSGPELRGLGWMMKSQTLSSGGDLISKRSFGHTGFTGTSLWCDPEKDLAVILLTNRVHAGRENQAIFRLRPLFANAVVNAIND